MDESQFGKLSGELRNCIYRLVLVFNGPFDFDTSTSKDFLTSRLRVRRALPFLTVCKQIRQEASSIFFGENTFVFHCDIRESQRRYQLLHVGAWLHRLRDSARHIRHVVFCIADWVAWMEPDDDDDDEDDEMIVSIPSRMKDLRYLFKRTSAIPRLRVKVQWSSFGEMNNDDGELKVLAEFEDGTTARKALSEILDRSKSMLARMESMYGIWSDEEFGSTFEDDLEIASGQAERLVKALESTLGS